MNFLVGVGRIERVGWMQLVSGIVTAAVIIAAVVIAHQGVTAVVVIASLAAVGGAWWYTAVVIRDYGVTFRGSWPASLAALHYGARAYLGTLSSQLWLRADFFVLNGYAGPAAVGEYSLATSLAEQVWILDSSVSQVILHDVIGSPADEAGRLVARTSRNVLFLTGAVCLSLAAVAPWLVPLVYGDAFRSAVTPLWLLLPGALGIAVARPVSSYFFGQLGKPQITSGVSIVTAVIGVGAYFALVPPFGASGAAAGSSIAYLVPLVAYIPLFGNLTGITARDMLLVSREDLAIYPHLLRSALGKVRLAGGAQPE
jgi:O-antigen/teichoic acid export membrane protein